MSRLPYNPILTFLLHLTQATLLRQIAFLKAENQLLRSRLPKAVQTTPAERSLLVRLGAPLGSGIRELIGIVHYRTFLRWVREERDGANAKKPRRKPGRPRISEDTTAIILRMARETGWGYARIQGELKKLGIMVAINSIKKILIKNGFHPSPWRTKGDWARFMQRHMDTLWACDFFTKEVWSPFGKATYYVLFFIHVGTRKVRVAGISCQPDGPWVEQHARNLAFDLGDQRGRSVYLLKDGDTKFTAKFDAVFESEGITVKRLPFASPNLNAHAERFVQSIKHECLDHFVVFGERHLEFLIREYEDHYNTVRPHQGRGNVPLSVIHLATTGPPDPAKIECDSRLGGLLRHYRPRAA